MEPFSGTDNSLDMLQTEGGFKTALFGFSRSAVLEYIDGLMLTNATRNKHLNNSLVEMENRLADLEDENESLLEKSRVLVDQLSEAKAQGDQSEKVNELNIIIGELNVQNEDFRYRIEQQQITIEDLNRQLYNKENEIPIVFAEEQQGRIDELNHIIMSKDQEARIILAENEMLKSQVQKLEERLELANESARYADETIVAAQRAASKIMNDAARSVPQPTIVHPTIDLTLLRDNIISLEKQIHNMVETVEFAVSGEIEPQSEQVETQGYYQDDLPKSQTSPTESGWITASAPQSVWNSKPVSSYWHPAERPSAPTGWQQPPQYVAQEAQVPLALQKQKEQEQSAPVYHHRKETVSKETVQLVRPTRVNSAEKTRPVKAVARRLR